jgi:nucleotide-binding universal stress UspA family protein
MSLEKNEQVFHRILIPVTGSESDYETMRMACWIAKRDKSRLYAMYVIKIKRSLPLEAEIESETRQAEGLLNNMAKFAESADVQIETDLLQAREVAPTIIDEAVERKIDLIILGIKYQRRFGQYTMGNTIPYILKNAPCHVMLYSQYNQPLG